ncbi:hypothetical protein [Thermomonospora umbrina]|uniref:Uncharacterized protein n=1 Tax=Thermomonospora umbrina TaxID=111806 RepID=A0A3D9TAD3_9ACTN|nr:hypothetical protein [Thermomonospora umbrina]REF00732.1 hypothetical protein DFJ69_6308 [Thermomonospora umbrina]
MLLPATSPQTHSLECVRIDDHAESHKWTTVPGTAVGTLLDQEAAELLDVVASIPTGDVMRCFMPGYGIRARSADGLILFEIAFCFQCNNALVLQPEPHQRQDLVGFKADSRRGQELLARFRAF